MPSSSISIHALLAESDRSKTLLRQYPNRFLSTLSLRRATAAGYHSRADRPHFYPRSPCGERQKERMLTDEVNSFLSTLSLRRATGQNLINGIGLIISIHALLAESDRLKTPCVRLSIISIHALLAESEVLGLLGWLRVLISIHALLAESDPLCRFSFSAGRISIHALLAESDPVREIIQWEGIFLSTLSLRRATLTAFFCPLSMPISIHALLAESEMLTTRRTF